MFYLDILKVDQMLYILQCHPPATRFAAARPPPKITVEVPEAGRRLRGAHPQVE
jgi:hypothetical protein